GWSFQGRAQHQADRDPYISHERLRERVRSDQVGPVRQSGLVPVRKPFGFGLSLHLLLRFMAYSSLKTILSQQLADIRTKGLYKSERQLLSPQQADIRVAQGHVLNLCANNY